MRTRFLAMVLMVFLTGAARRDSGRDFLTVEWPRPPAIDLVMKADCYRTDCQLQVEDFINSLWRAKTVDDLATIAVLFDYPMQHRQYDLLSKAAANQGPQMSHLLFLKSISRSDCRQRFPFNRRCPSESERLARLSLTRDLIKKGAVFFKGCEKDLDVVEFDMKALGIAMRFHELETGKTASNLMEVKTLIDEIFETNLRIINPCGKPYTVSEVIMHQRPIEETKPAGLTGVQYLEVDKYDLARKLKIEWPYPRLMNLYMKPDSTFQDMDKVMDGIDSYSHRTSNISRAELAVIADYPIDAAVGETHYEVLLEQGEVMVPFLFLKIHTPSECRKRFPDHPRCSADQVRAEHLTWRLINLEDGAKNDWPEKCMTENRAKLYDYDKEMIELAVRLYYRDKGVYPKSLDYDLKSYFFRKYRTRLRTGHPCGGFYHFKVKLEVDVSGDKWIEDEIYSLRKKAETRE